LPAWIVLPDSRKIVPISRVAIGDITGNVIFNRHIVIDGLVDLVNEVASAIDATATTAVKMEGFVFDIPSSRKRLLSEIESAEKLLARARVKLAESNLLVDRSKPSEDPKPEDEER